MSNRINKSHPKIIGFERLHSQVGDCVISVKALYALSVLYPESKIIVFTSQMGKNLFKNYNFIHQIIVVDTSTNRENNFLNALLKYKIDILLLLHRTSWKIRIAKLSKIPKVITEMHMHTLFSKQFKSPSLHISRFVHGTKKILKLVRRIDTKHYDKNIAKIDFSKAKLQTSNANKITIKLFLDSFKDAWNWDGGIRKIVGINPFGRANAEKFNFLLSDWVYLAESLAKEFPQVLFIFTTYTANPQKIEKSKRENIKIFCNDEDILNLVEIIAHFDLLLSVDTGNIHIADNLLIPTLATIEHRKKDNCCGGSYGGEFEAICLSKNCEENHKHYLEIFHNKAREKIQNLIKIKG